MINPITVQTHQPKMTLPGFTTSHTAGEKLIAGRLFPLTLTPPPTSSRTCDDLLALIKQERAGLAAALRLHGAIILRGFAVDTAEDFSDVVEALGWEEFEYFGGGSRVKVAGRALKSVNDPPLDQLINFHHEMSTVKESTPKIIFYCLQRAPEGGQTSVIASEMIVEKMEERLPHVAEKLQKEGMLTVIQTAAWQRMFKTEDPLEAEKRAMESQGCSSVKFSEDGSATIIIGPRNPVREINGKRVWFNTLLGYDAFERVATVRYGDGTPLPKEAEEVYQNILDENCVDVNWEKGDVLVLDNMAVQHARRPGKPPRVLLLALTY